LIKDLDYKWLVNNPECQFVSRKNITDDLALEEFTPPHNDKLSVLYGNIRFALGIKTTDTDAKKNIIDIVLKDEKSLIT
jgi:hypothetical protein